MEGLADNIVIDKDKCTACGICVDTCILDNLRLELSPCRRACPLGVNCQGYVQLIARGQEAEALIMLQETLPFAGILSRICSQPCEAECQRRQTDGEAVAIRALKRYLVDQASAEEIPLPDMQADSSKKVAIIGSGPAGMMAAHDLRCHGHAVTIFEAEASAGGMLRNAIPEFRLPHDILEKDLGLLHRMDVDFQCSTRVGQNISVEILQDQFDAMVIACGCPRHVTLGGSGENLKGVYYGLPFLRAARSDTKPVVGKEVVIIGGGNVAVDAAQTALRLGAHKVSMVCLESYDEIPAYPNELQSALADGVNLECSWGSVRFYEKQGVLNGVEFQRCLKVFDETGGFSPEFDDCELKSLDADTVIVAIGQERFMDLMEDLDLVNHGEVSVDPLTLQCRHPHIFMAGDVVTGPLSAVEAMGQGRRAAESAHRFLSGDHLTYGRRYAGPIVTDFSIDESRGASIARAALREHECDGPGDFQEIEQTWDTETAREQASRCHSCGVPFGQYRTCWFCLPCEVECPKDALYVEIPYLLR